MAQVRANSRDVVLFTRQLNVLFRSGVPLLPALESLAHQAEDPALGEVVWTLHDSVSSGSMLSSSLAAFPRVFSGVYVRMVRVGETTGDLPGALGQLADWMERDDRVGQKVRAAMTYPLCVFTLGGLLTLGLFTFVLPPFLSMLTGMDVPLPWSTRVVLLLTQALHQPGFWLCMLCSGALAGSWLWTRLRHPALWRFLMRVPLLGRLLVLSSLSRYLSAAYALLTSGVDVLVAWRLAAESSGSPLLASDSRLLADHLREGGTVAAHMLARPELYTRTLGNVVRASEETSTAVSLFPRLQALYEHEVEAALDSLSSVLEPLMLMAVASVMGFAMVSAFLPLYSYLSTL